VDPPAAVVPGVQLSGNTENRIATLVGVQESQIAAIANALRAQGFTIDPNKSSIGLTGTQQFYADVVGVLVGAEDDVKRSAEYQLFHQLYASMPSNLTDAQLTQLQGLWGRVRGFSQLVTEINNRRIAIAEARAANNAAEVRRLEGEIAVIAQRQQSAIGQMAQELQGMGFQVDESKTTLGLTGSQRFYGDVVGVLVGTEDDIKRTDEYRLFHQLYASMPSNLTDAQLTQLQGLWARVRGYSQLVTEINNRRIAITQARADGNNAEVRRLEGEIAVIAQRQRTALGQMAQELQGMGFQVDESKTTLGLTGSQQFYADVVGVLVGAEDDVKRSEEYRLFHQLYASMPSNLTDAQLEQLRPLWARVRGFSQSVTEINNRRIAIAEARAAGNNAEVRRLEGEIAVIAQRQQSVIGQMAQELQGMGFQVDESKTSLGLTGSQRFYGDVVGVLVGAEDDVKRSAEYQLFHQLYASMPSNLTDAQLEQLQGLWGRVRGFSQLVTEINDRRVAIAQARADGNAAEVRRLEGEIAVIAQRQRTAIGQMAQELQGMGFQVDPNKTSLGLTGSQQFYADLVGVLVGTEDDIKRTDEYRLFHQLYASMPSNLSDAQLAQLRGLWGRARGYAQLVTEINDRRILITQARADGNAAEVRRLEGEIAVIAQRQRTALGQMAQELQGMGFQVDESKTSLGLTGSQQFYNDLAGILTGAEDDVRQSAAFNDLRQLYASMPSNLTDAQVQQLRGVWAQIRGFYPISNQINGLRVDLVQERAAARGN
jgi:extradiol dioxygenase family protein